MEFRVVENKVKWDVEFDDDFEDVQKLSKEFYKVAEKVRNFYTTVFLNRTNRKVGLYFSNGKLTKISIDVIDLEREEDEPQF